MRSTRLCVAVAALFSAVSSPAAALLQNVEWALRLDGAVLFDNFPPLGDPSPVIPGLNLVSFNIATGIGDITYTINTPGTHYFVGFFDHQIVEDGTPNNFINERGALLVPFSTAAAGQVAEVGDSCLGGGACLPSIYDRALDITPGVHLLQNTPGVFVGPTDIALAMGWSFNLAAGETATITLRLICTQAALGCNVAATHLGNLVVGLDDPVNGGGTGGSVFLSGSLRIDGGGTPPVPEPRTTVALALALVGLVGFFHRSKAS